MANEPSDNYPDQSEDLVLASGFLNNPVGFHSIARSGRLGVALQWSLLAGEAPLVLPESALFSVWLGLLRAVERDLDGHEHGYLLAPAFAVAIGVHAAADSEMRAATRLASKADARGGSLDPSAVIASLTSAWQLYCRQFLNTEHTRADSAPNSNTAAANGSVPSHLRASVRDLGAVVADLGNEKLIVGIMKNAAVSGAARGALTLAALQMCGRGSRRAALSAAEQQAAADQPSAAGILPKSGGRAKGKSKGTGTTSPETGPAASGPGLYVAALGIPSMLASAAGGSKPASASSSSRSTSSFSTALPLDQLFVALLHQAAEQLSSATNGADGSSNSSSTLDSDFSNTARTWADQSGAACSDVSVAGVEAVPDPLAGAEAADAVHRLVIAVPRTNAAAAATDDAAKRSNKSMTAVTERLIYAASLLLSRVYPGQHRASSSASQHHHVWSPRLRWEAFEGLVRDYVVHRHAGVLLPTMPPALNADTAATGDGAAAAAAISKSLASMSLTGKGAASASGGEAEEDGETAAAAAADADAEWVEKTWVKLQPAQPPQPVTPACITAYSRVMLALASHYASCGAAADALSIYHRLYRWLAEVVLLAPQWASPSQSGSEDAATASDGMRSLHPLLAEVLQAWQALEVSHGASVDASEAPAWYLHDLQCRHGSDTSGGVRDMYRAATHAALSAAITAVGDERKKIAAEVKAAVARQKEVDKALKLAAALTAGGGDAGSGDTAAKGSNGSKGKGGGKGSKGNSAKGSKATTATPSASPPPPPVPAGAVASAASTTISAAASITRRPLIIAFDAVMAAAQTAAAEAVAGSAPSSSSTAGGGSANSGGSASMGLASLPEPIPYPIPDEPPADRLQDLLRAAKAADKNDTRGFTSSELLYPLSMQALVATAAGAGAAKTRSKPAAGGGGGGGGGDRRGSGDGGPAASGAGGGSTGPKRGRDDDRDRDRGGGAGQGGGRQHFGAAGPASSYLASLPPEVRLTLPDAPRQRAIRPNYFLSVRLKDERLWSAVSAVQDSVLSACPGLASCRIPVLDLHLTLAVLTLKDAAAIDHAKGVLQSCAPHVTELYAMAASGSVSSSGSRSPSLPVLTVRGVDHFRGAVLFAKPHVDAHYARLVELARRLQAAFHEAGLTQDAANATGAIEHQVAVDSWRKEVASKLAPPAASLFMALSQARGGGGGHGCAAQHAVSGSSDDDDDDDDDVVDAGSGDAAGAAAARVRAASGTSAGINADDDIDDVVDVATLALMAGVDGSSGLPKARSAAGDAAASASSSAGTPGKAKLPVAAKGFHPHITLFKLSKGQNLKGKGRHGHGGSKWPPKFIGKELWASHADADLGCAPLTGVELSEMTAREKETGGYYKCHGKLEFPSSSSTHVSQ